MAKTRNMVQILDPEEFERNKQALLRFERNMVELGGIKGVLTNSKVLQIMSRTCSSVWGTGSDLYLASQERTFEMVRNLVVSQVDENISLAVRALADWLELKITYERRGSNFKFRFQKQTGEFKELQLHMREPQNQRPVH